MTTPSFNPFLLLARWLPGGVDAKARIAVQRALCDAFLMEAPPGSNRGKSIDEYNIAAGGRLGDPYCASAFTAWWRAAGLETPPHDAGWWIQHKLKYLPPASCDAWRLWALLTDRFTTYPEIGGAVLYGTPEDATHIGMVIRLDPLLMTFEANTSADGKFNREGFCFDRKFLDRASTRLIGFVVPYPTASPTPRRIT